MRDPDLVTRAQRAAVALERAWERWRAMHGLSAEPMPPVSSYVGYSIEEPWGRPRVVFGVDAREAELLAALLDHHECVGPFYQADPSDAGRPGSAGKDSSPLDEARSRIPAQAQAAEERPPQRWGQDAEPGAADGGPDGLAGDDHGAEPRYPDRRSPQENGAAEPPRPDETRGDSGRPARPSPRAARRGGQAEPAGAAHGQPAAVGRAAGADDRGGRPGCRGTRRGWPRGRGVVAAGRARPVVAGPRGRACGRPHRPARHPAARHPAAHPAARHRQPGTWQPAARRWTAPPWTASPSRRLLPLRTAPHGMSAPRGARASTT